MVSKMSDGTCRGTARDLNVFADNFDPSSCLSRTVPCPVSDESMSSHKSRKCTSIHSSNANTPQAPLQATGTNGLASPATFDPFVTAPTPLSAAGVGTVPANPYSPDSAAVAATAAALNGAAFFANQSGFQQPVSPYFTPFYLMYLTLCRSNIISMLPLDLIAKIPWAISATFTISSSPTIFERSYRRKQLRRCKCFLVR